MNPLRSPSICAKAKRHEPYSQHMDSLNPFDEGGFLGLGQPCAAEVSGWNETATMSTPSSELSSWTALTPPSSFPPTETLPTPTALQSRTHSDKHLIVVDQHGRECEVVQTRGERRRAQNRKAQRAYRARKEAQIKTASSTLAANKSQLRTLSHHNRELLETIKHLREIILRLEAENQLLKEVQSPNINGMHESGGWMLDSPIFMSPLPSEAYWHEERSDTTGT
ncbi:hypothetical protein AYL99_01754 [Fonsecaea erecta]|uniref:BZIP domain-containing protein n=1 Tax=Fonsecaea erecta TaxID=1367422 RepID=A0A179A1B5_9EURO|nr:hypothetical protein AYL99_01754 [Fonsecaea erecta]OAP65782.1 hypothetical protein AYL99_01754 [Fonsecaea erecta]